ncbi:MAG TPA: LPXTG cell wall anchor domain-containing protein [Silvibacterium sp.]|jgi:LPXTG-motif cell wall-anchored protein|nr:LPXTG cell wall anchor domain-containing protein [Silvibacterium sp.]
MNSKGNWSRVGTVLAVGAVSLVFAISMSAQVETATTTTHGTASHEVSVESGEVVLVDGNDLIIRNDQGQIVHFPNVPNSTKFHVGGQDLSVHDLKPGTKLERTVTVTTTPKLVTTTDTVTGTVWHVTPPTRVILTLDDGTNQQFNIPRGQRFMVDGRETDANGLRRGMKVSATRVTEEPMTVVNQHTQITGTAPPPPPPPPAATPILVVVSRPAPAPAPEAAPEAAALPKTGSIVPLIGLVGLVFLGVSFGLTMLRKSRFMA